MATKLFLIRHGETEWSLSGRHTGRTDIPLTANGERAAQQLRPLLAPLQFSRVVVSPLRRAQHTAELAGCLAGAVVDDDLHEWDYGVYEGKTSAEIRAAAPDWNVFEFGAPGGESREQVTARADRVLARLQPFDGAVALFSHGQFLRALAMRWIQQDVSEGRHFAFDAASISVLGYEHPEQGLPTILLWNASASQSLSALATKW